jgi:hypothetical protein
MSSFGPDPTWACPRPSLRLLPALLLASLALAFALTPAARAQEADPAVAGEPAAATEPPIDLTPVPEAEPIPEPPPPPEPAPSQELAVSEPEPPPAPEPAASAVEPPQQTADRDVVAHAGPASFEPAAATFTPAAQAPAAPMLELSSPAAAPTTEPLGWDLYDDALFAETIDGDDTASALGGGGTTPSIGRLIVLPAIRVATERDKRDTEPVSRADAMPAGGSLPGGSGPGRGPSLSLFGGSGGSGAAFALLSLLGLACGWLLLAPDGKRAFRMLPASRRPAAYVPPIESPG